MKITMTTIRNLILVSAVCAAGVASAQQASINLDRNFDRGEEGTYSSVDADGVFEVAYRFEQLKNLSGGSFQIRYDNSILSVADSSECLSGLPGTHQSGYSVCNVFEDKGVIQFIILDVGKNRPIGDEILGSILFATKGSLGNSEAELLLEIGDVRLAGPDGRHLTVPSEKSKYINVSTIEE